MRVVPRACSASATGEQLRRALPTGEAAARRFDAGAGRRRWSSRRRSGPGSSELRAGVGGEGDGDDIAEEMRPALKRESEPQAELKAASDKLTCGRGRGGPTAATVVQRRPRSWSTIAERLGEEVQPAEEPLSEEERSEIERGSSGWSGARPDRARQPARPRASMRRPASDRRALQVQREDTERGCASSEGLIRDIDAEIERAFEETSRRLRATSRRWPSTFPGGRKLRRVSLRAVADDAPAGEQEAPTDAGAGCRGRGREARRS